ncbi:hypothetical protein O3G_MSEX008657 [Manduca sexta]|uniref:Uncharacterized protein n=1 Tax=Manduca sexta TaxID=7130 RepID=A0A922CQB9_MANSE|nr:hypothetical protein O3G_MSEX008657 [Manduca sexta]
MDDPDNYTSQTADIKNVLPDVVHSQQIPVVGVVDADENIDTGQNVQQELSTTHTDDSKTESISEDVPSKCQYSTDSESNRAQGLLTVDNEQEQVSRNSSLNLPLPQSPLSENQNTQNPSKLSTSWPLDMNADVHLISEESPVNLALSSDREVTYDNTPDRLNIDRPEESPKSDHYLDSLNRSDNSHVEEAANKSDDEKSPERSSESEEIIKLDIRGQGVPKFSFPAAKIIFGPPPEGSEVIDANVDPLPVFPNLLSPFLVGAGDTVKVEEVFDNEVKELSPDKSLDVTPDKSLSSDKIEQSDLLIEEIMVDDELKEKESEGKESLPPKSIPVEEASFSTLTTDYKTICEEYHGKVVM